jgi:precorrin-6B methylase 2
MAATVPARVTLCIAAADAGSRAVQHAAILLATLLTRSTTAIVEHIDIDCPADTQLRDGVSPHARPGTTLLQALLDTAPLFGADAAPVYAASSAHHQPPRPGAPVLRFHVGAASCSTCGAKSAQSRHTSQSQVWYLAGAGWTGMVSDQPIPREATELAFLTADTPIGAYVAACLAAGMVFLQVRIDGYEPKPLAIDAWTLAIGSPERVQVSQQPSDMSIAVDHVLAGVGAVGSALLQTLWATPQVSGHVHAIDADERGIDRTNLNRCVIFTKNDIGDMKAPAAQRILSPTHGLRINGDFGAAQSFINGGTRLISAVDTAEARLALQDRYPRAIVQASTRDLRLEMLRVDPTAMTPCLRCFNPPTATLPDQQVRAGLDLLDDAAVNEHARALGVNGDDVRQWAREGGCGQLGDQMLERLRPSAGTAPEFSVGFVSVLAGVLLACQVIKDAYFGAQVETAEIAPALVGDRARFTTNLVAPLSPLGAVRTYQRDRSCPCCAPGARRDIWLRRWTG